MSNAAFALSDEWNEVAVEQARELDWTRQRFVITDASALVAPAKTGENVFRALAHSDPGLLLRYLSENVLDPADTALAAEIVGEELKGSEALDVLIQLLAHYSPIAREGAVFGLAHHVQSEAAKSALRRHLASSGETSAAVLEAIQDVLGIDL